MTILAPIFNISPQRSGTKSFHALMEAHGVSSVHYPGEALEEAIQDTVLNLDTDRLWSLCGGYYAGATAFSDFPTPLIYRQALRANPRASFVLIQRDVAAWVRSVRVLAHDRDLSWLERFFYHSIAGQSWDHAGLSGYSDGELANGYRLFCLEAQAYLTRHDAKLFVGDLEDPALVNKLAGFLGIDFDKPLAHLV